VNYCFDSRTLPRDQDVQRNEIRFRVTFGMLILHVQLERACRGPFTWPGPTAWRRPTTVSAGTLTSPISASEADELSPQWAWEQELIETPPRFPKPREQRDVAGRYYLTKAEINALYFATHKMERPRGWDQLIPIGRFWRSALVVFFNYGLDTGTVWKSAPFHEPILWRHVSWGRQSPDREAKELSRWGWLFYRRAKTGKTFYRPMNRVVHAHIKSIMPENPRPDDAIFLGGGARPNARFRDLCNLAGIKPRMNIETGDDETWELKDLRKTCATYYDAHVPESSIEILGHSVGGITYRHYAHRAPLAFKAIMTIPQPTAFLALIRGFDGECPCCRRRFTDAQ
jgi:integrase